MAGGYTDTPHNMEEILPYVIVGKERTAAELLGNQTCYFYDTCSFRRHSNLKNGEADYLFRYVKKQKGIVVITRCILMELASKSGILNQEDVLYIRQLAEAGIKVLILYEEDIFAALEICFSTNAVINQYLCWSVRTMKIPVSTITKTLEENADISEEIIKGKNLDNGGVYKRFFQTVRKNKEAGDDLGEELLAICLHILSYLPGEEDGKFCVITDDKGGAGKMDALFKKTAKQHKGKKIGIFSTPKLVQILYREGILEDKNHINALLSAGTSGNLVVLGACIYDIRSREISVSSEELTNLIRQPNGIHIIF